MLVNLLKVLEKMNKSKESAKLINLIIDFIAYKEDFLDIAISSLAEEEKRP